METNFCFSFLISLIPLILRKWTPESSLWKSRKREERGVLLNNTIYNPSFLKVFFKCLVAGIIQFFGYYLINLALPLYLTSIGLSLTSASYFILIIGAGVWFGGVLGAYITDRIGRIRTEFQG
jgi:Major Facilitator Superfamily.